jgi:aspartate kinase
MSGGIVVLKFGGTSVATAVRVRRAARRVRAHRRAGQAVAVVVSANGAATDRILARLAGLAPGGAVEPTREADRALVTGEDLSAALLAYALTRLGVAARSLRGPEAGVRGEGEFGGAHVAHVDPAPLRVLLEAGVVPVISGFQAGRADGEAVTLGRGGSDTSAVAVAAALGAACHIVTDVAAVFDRDPRLDPDAMRLDAMGYDELVRLTESGARVVHPEAARIARAAGVPLRIYHHRAPLFGRGGTRVGDAEARLEGAA